MKKKFLLLLALCLLFVLPLAARAENLMPIDWGENTPPPQPAEPDTPDALYQTLTAGIGQQLTEIDLSGFGIPVDAMDSLFSGWMDDHPELYYVDKEYQMSYDPARGTVVRIYPTYLEVTDKASAEAFEAAVQEALACVLPGMDDVQKALVLHDWVVRNVEYDETLCSSRKIYSAYGALAEHLAVCEGYSRAYQLLLRRCGIDCVFITSEGMGHAWNAVKLGDHWYHADTTWDDGGVGDLVLHSYFLCSDAGFLAREHSGWVSKVVCDDDSLDAAFWNGVDSAICFPNEDEAYYLTDAFDESVFKMQVMLVKRNWETGEAAAVSTVNDQWNVWDQEGYFYTDAFASFCLWYDLMYFNDSLHIYRFDPLTGETETVLTYDGAEGYLYGLHTQGDKLSYRLSTAPDASGELVDSGLVPVVPPVCEYCPDERTLFVNSAFAGKDTLLCAGYHEDGRMLYACFLTPDEENVLPLEAPVVRIFRLGSGFTPVVGKPLDMLT